MIELLVVLAIISLLAALLFPALARARLDSYNPVCQSNLHQLGVATQMYCSDYDDRLPHAVDPFSRSLIAVSQMILPRRDIAAFLKLPIQRLLLMPYTGRNKEIYHCPADRIMVPAVGGNFFQDYGSSYHYTWYPALFSMSPSQFTKPATTLLMGDWGDFHGTVVYDAVGRANELFMDYHVKNVTMESLNISEWFPSYVQ